MSESTPTEIDDHEKDDGPGESDPHPYPRRRPSVRPATLVAAVAGVLAVAFAVGGVTTLLPAGQASGAARPVAQVGSVTARPRAHARPAPKPRPSTRPSPKQTARHSPKRSKRKPAARHAAPARHATPARQAAPEPIIVRLLPPAPAVPRPNRAPAKPPAKHPARRPARRPASHAPVPRQISGYVQCSTMAVEGVWIVAKNGGSGWAKWTAEDSASTARYTYRLPKGGRYAVHVGCGGSPADWLTTPDSGVVSGTFNDFVCYDVAGQGAYGFCKHIN